MKRKLSRSWMENKLGNAKRMIGRHLSFWGPGAKVSKILQERVKRWTQRLKERRSE